MPKPIHLVAGVLFALGLVACDDDSTTSPDSRSGVAVTFSTQALVALNRAEGDLTITRARVLLRDVKFHTPDGPEELEFATGPHAIELKLDGSVNEVVAARVPAGTYDEIRFEIHKLDDDDPRDLRAMEEPEFQDFAGDDRWSILVDGTYDDGNGAAPFTFASDVNEEQRVFLSRLLTIGEDDEVVNVTLVVDTGRWFDGGAEGTLNPSRTENRDRIEDNIEASIDLFEDRDRDGVDDHADRSGIGF